jgi:methionyl-tRNA formyltransferase
VTQVYHFPAASPGSGRVLFFGRGDHEQSTLALEHLKRLGFDVTFVESRGRGEKLPSEADAWEGEYILCFRSYFIVPKRILDRASVAAINIHPAPVEYPGTGCANFALYDQALQYGVTAHLMTEKVDAGPVLECRRFPILPSDTVTSLLDRTHRMCLELFLDVTGKLAESGAEYVAAMAKKSAHEKWRGDARKIGDLEKLQTVPLDVSRNELERIIRATDTDLFPTKVVLHGYEFHLKRRS